jgi:hypothetical protein
MSAHNLACEVAGAREIDTGELNMKMPTKRMINWSLLSCVAVLGSSVSWAQLKSVDHGAEVIDSHGLMWANTVGIQLGWNPGGGPGTAQAWIANLNATDYGGYNNWSLATGNFNVGPNTTSNQLGELFYTDCGNALGTQTSLSHAGKNCGALSALGTAMKVGMGLGGSSPGDILISSGTYLGPVPPFVSWSVFDTSNSSERYWDSDTIYYGVTGQADVVAVRHVTAAPELDLSFAATAVTFLLGLLAVLGGRKRTPVKLGA